MEANESPHSPQKRAALTVLRVAPRADHHRSLPISFSVCSSQYVMLISRYTVTAAVKAVLVCRASMVQVEVSHLPFSFTSS